MTLINVFSQSVVKSTHKAHTYDNDFKEPASFSTLDNTQKHNWLCDEILLNIFDS